MISNSVKNEKSMHETDGISPRNQAKYQKDRCVAIAKQAPGRRIDHMCMLHEAGIPPELTKWQIKYTMAYSESNLHER